MGEDFYSPGNLALLRDQIREAVATGLPWLVESARKAFEMARDAGAPITFNERGEDGPAGNTLPPVSQQVTDNNAGVRAAIVQAQQDGGIATPSAPEETNDQVLAAIAAAQAQTPAQAPVAPAAEEPPSLGADPALLAFQRALGLERDTARRNTQLQEEGIDRSTALRLPQIGEQGQISRERLSGGFEDRGLLRSGQHETALARQRQSEANVTASVQDQAAQRKSALEQALAQTETGFDTRLAEQNLNAAQRQQDFTNSQQVEKSRADQNAALLAAQQRSTDALNARFDQAIRQFGVTGGPGSTTTAAPARPQAAPFDPGNPTAGIVGIVPADDDPARLAKLLALKQQQGG